MNEIKNTLNIDISADETSTLPHPLQNTAVVKSRNNEVNGSKSNTSQSEVRPSLDHHEEALNELFKSNFSTGVFQVILVVLTGCVIGIVTLGFQYGQESLEKLYIHDFAVGSFSKPITCLIMVFSAGISSFIGLYGSRKWFPECLGGGIIPLKIAIGVSTLIPYYFIFARAFITTVYISFGNPLGIEGPVLHISGAIASQFYLIGTYFSREIFDGTLSTTLMVGTAAGISAAFNTPLAGIFYAVEEFLDIRKFGFVTILVGFASVASILVLRLLKGEDLLFMVNDSSLLVFGEHDSVVRAWMIGSVLLGVICGIVGYVFKISVVHLREYIYYSEHPIGNRHVYLVSIVSGLTVGVIGTIVFLFTDSKYSWGSGTHWIDEVLDFTSSGWKYLGFGIMKAVACVIAVSVGGNGGVFVPSLIIGASIGGAFASLMCTLFDEGSNTLDPIDNRDCIWFTSFIEFGMAGVFTSILRLPLTSIVIVYELTNFADVASSLIIPLLTCVLCSFAINLYLEEDSIYELLLKQDGVCTLLIQGAAGVPGESDVIDLNDPFCSRSCLGIDGGKSNLLTNSRNTREFTASPRIVGVLDPNVPRPGTIPLVASMSINKIRHSRSSRRRGSLTNEDTEGYAILNKLADRANESRTQVTPDRSVDRVADSMKKKQYSFTRPISPVNQERVRRYSVPNIDNGRIYYKEKNGRFSFVEENSNV